MTPDEQHIADLMRLHTDLGRRAEAELLRMSENEMVINIHKKLAILIKQTEAMQAHLSGYEAPFRIVAGNLEEQRADVLDRIKDSWEADLGDTKNYIVEDGHEKITAQYRVTRSIEIVDAAKIVDVLIANEKVAEGVATFRKPFLRSLKDVGLLDDETAKYTEKRNVNIHVEVIK